MPRRRARIVRTAHKLQAIKLVRELTNVGLKDAKDIVEGQQWFEFELGEQARESIDEHVREFGSEFDYEPDTPDTPAPAPAGSIDPRLLDPRFEVRADLRYLDGPQKIAAIKLARELTGLGLKDTKDLVEQQGWVLRDVPIAEAQLVERRFVEVGSRVEIVPRSLSIMAFDPRHPARAAQPLVRMRVTGHQLEIERGRIDAWEPASAVQTFDAPEQLQAAIEQQCRAWTDAGLALERDAIALLGRTSAREPALEHTIREAEDPREALLVYADWLAAQGDPRGELAPLQQVEATQEFEAALARNATHLFGPLQHFVGQLKLEWRVGMVARVECPAAFQPAREPVFESFRKLLALPIMACVRSLSLRGAWLAHADTIAAWPSEVLTGVRELELENSGFDPLVVADWRPLERLERLSLDAGGVQGGPLELPSLRSLYLSTRTVDAGMVGLFTDASLGRLDDFELHLELAPNTHAWVEDYGETMRELLKTLSRQVPLRRRFCLRIDEGTLDSRIVGMIFDAPLASRVARLELIATLDAEALKTYEKRRAKLPAQVELSLVPPRG